MHSNPISRRSSNLVFEPKVIQCKFKIENCKLLKELKLTNCYKFNTLLLTLLGFVFLMSLGIENYSKIK